MYVTATGMKVEKTVQGMLYMFKGHLWSFNVRLKMSSEKR